MNFSGNFAGLASFGWKEALIALCIALFIYIALICVRLWRLKQQKNAPFFATAAHTIAPGTNNLIHPNNAQNSAANYKSMSAIAAYGQENEPSLNGSFQKANTNVDDLASAPSALAAFLQEKQQKAETASSRKTAAWQALANDEEPVDLRSIERINALENELVTLRKDRKRLTGLEQEIDQLRKELAASSAQIMGFREDLQEALAFVDAEREKELLREKNLERVKEQEKPAISPLYNDAMQMAEEGHNAEAIAKNCAISRAEADLVIALAEQNKEKANAAN